LETVISQMERSNFLRQCWRRGHWKDGVGTVLSPLRVALYRLRRDAFRGRDVSPRVRDTAKEIELPQFSAELNTIFCETAPGSAASIARPERLFAEVDRQLGGNFRLAGGRSRAMADWDAESAEDPEDAHAYHRLYWALRYAQAAGMGHPRAKHGLLSELPAWFDQCDRSPIAAWPYTVAERIGSLSEMLFWFPVAGDSSLDALILPIKRQIFRDGVRLSSSIEYGLGVHNHLLNDARGMFLAGAALADCEEAKGWRDLAFEIWDEYFPKLVLPDGTLSEKSSHYHILLCRTALEYSLACRRSNRSVASGFEERLQAMFDLANELVRPDGSLPRFGDNSPDRTIEDLWGLLAAAHHYGLLKQPPRHRAITPLTLFYCGARPELPAALNRAPRQSVFPAGGFAFLRSEDLPVEVAAHADRREDAGTHGDSGCGSFELWWDGQALIREPGSFSSNSDANWMFYQSAQAQNVTALDGLAPALTKQDRRFLVSWYAPKGGTWRETGGDGIGFRCESFRRLHADIVLFRTWRFETSGTLRFDERIEGTKQVSFESRLCLGDTPWTAEESSDPSVVNFTSRREDGRSVEMTVRAPQNAAISIQPCRFLPEYGVEKTGRVLVLKGAQSLPCSWNAQWTFRKES